MNRKNAAPTIRAVASEAGVSVATVSAVINQTRFVSAETARRVNEAIKRSGYRPNRLARGLSTRETKTIGIVMPTILSPIAPLLLKSAADVLHEHGYAVLFSNTEMQTTWEEQAIELMFDSQVDGLLVVPASETLESLKLFSDARKPVVLLLHGLEGASGCDVIRSGNFRGSFDAVNHLIGQGARRIAVLALPLVSESEKDRMNGFRTGVLAAGRTLDPELMRVGAPSESGASEDHGYRETLRLMDLDDPPDAIFAMNQYMAIGSLSALKELGLRIPTDVALVGYDDLIWTKNLEPPMSVVAQQVELIGRMGATRLVHRLAENNHHSPAESVTVDTQLIIRASSNRDALTPSIDMENTPK
ncbi:LacI family DNA-binding transcriptional regulator [Paenarthrobacter sp. Z7-10]|uniref:LacI family DNA-binding transcriptional regulator n=1 Tax=Paenarthrobacter sp. Z7-10 TaxID=2787635 RepID=UPI0022A90428|nr:LacI family DNA-binding transcriptional regulator [Paenarthrobacter sp. Z7-10]MCZ2403574.1 LacI family DNA-binding transcriptional regulator [Paenarthrobacter sp. Z7-10]